MCRAVIVLVTSSTLMLISPTSLEEWRHWRTAFACTRKTEVKLTGILSLGALKADENRRQGMMSTHITLYTTLWKFLTLASTPNVVL